MGTGNDEKTILNLFASGSDVGRALVAPPDIPPERATVLRSALAATLADPELIALASKGSLVLEPGSPDELEGIVRKVLATPKSIADKAKAVLESMKAQR